MKIVINGCAGRMGRTLLQMVRDDDRLQLAGGLESSTSAFLGQDVSALIGGEASGILVTDNALAVISQADAIIDFSHPAVSTRLSALAAQARIVHVIGTTGFSAAEEEAILAASRHAMIVKSGNMSLGVNVLAELVEQAAKVLADGWDIEIVDMHHRHKIDAPSGTALLLGEAAARGRGVELQAMRESGRDGIAGARGDGAIGFAALRGGSVVGDHDVIFAGAGEQIRLSHRAESRDIFAKGALEAAIWAHGKAPGLYSMRDVLGLKTA